MIQVTAKTTDGREYIVALVEQEATLPQAKLLWFRYYDKSLPWVKDELDQIKFFQSNITIQKKNYPKRR